MTRLSRKRVNKMERIVVRTSSLIVIVTTKATMPKGKRGRMVAEQKNQKMRMTTANRKITMTMQRKTLMLMIIIK